MKQVSVASKSVIKVHNNSGKEHSDLLSVEEPLEIKLGYGPENDRAQKSIALTMRTPGNDFELALGFLFTEGIIQTKNDFFSIKYCKDSTGNVSNNMVRIELQPTIQLNWENLSRHFYTNSSCGICGKASIESLEGMCSGKIQSSLRVKAELLHTLNKKMKESQTVFNYTGSIHAAALFNEVGELILLREDVGRHNALDKIIGASLTNNYIPLENTILMLSGRCSFELIQKALMANIPIVAAVGAPSSLSVNTAEQYGVTLLGFVKNNGFNIYTLPEKIVYETSDVPILQA